MLHLHNASLLLLTLAAVAFASCSSDDEPDIQLPDTHQIVHDQTNDRAEMSMLQLRIDSLNQTLTPEVPEQRGKVRRWFRRIIKIVAADASGALTCISGGLPAIAAGAISSSCAAALDLHPSYSSHTSLPKSESVRAFAWNQPINDRSVALTNVVPVSPSRPIPTLADSIGYYHNLVMLDLRTDFTSNPISLADLRSRVSVNTARAYRTDPLAMNALLEENGLYRKIVYSQYRKKVFSSIDELTFTWIYMMPEKASELKVMGEFYKGMMRLSYTTNDNEYLQKVLELLDSTRMSNEVKQSLRNGIITGNASYRLWAVE